MRTYTVVGVYNDPMGQRYATTVEAVSPRDAEIAARHECAVENGLDPSADVGLLIAGVLEGEVELLDMHTDGVTGELDHGFMTVVVELDTAKADEMGLDAFESVDGTLDELPFAKVRFVGYGDRVENEEGGERR